MIKPYIGGRFLVRKRHCDDVVEVTVDEISPSLEYFRPHGFSWGRIDEYVFMEELPLPAKGKTETYTFPLGEES